jgi:hypothetical protein
MTQALRVAGQRLEDSMKIEEWPNFIAVKVLQLEARAKTLAAQAEVLTAQAECVRDEITGRTTTKAAPQALRAEFERLLKAASEAQARQQIEEGVLAVCRQWMDDLSADVKLDPVPIDVPADATLASVRERLRAARDEIVALRRAPVPAKDIEQRIADYVHGLANAGRPVVSGVGEGEKLTIVWPQHANVKRARPHIGFVAGRADPLLMTAYLSPDVLIDKLMAEVEGMAATPLPVAARQPRIAALAAEVDRLQRVEEVLVVANGDQREPGRPESAVLGCRVVEARGDSSPKASIGPPTQRMAE